MNIIKISAIFVMLVFTLFGASAEVQAFGFTMFGYHFSNSGIEKQVQENVRNQTTGQARIEERTQERVEERNEIREQNIYENQNIINEDEIVDIEEILTLANADKQFTANLKTFSGDDFCVQTDKRLAYFRVNEDGTVGWLSGEPKKYATIKTTEGYLSKVSRQARNGETVTQKDIGKNVKIPFRLKAKLMWANIMQK